MLGSAIEMKKPIVIAVALFVPAALVVLLLVAVVIEIEFPDVVLLERLEGNGGLVVALFSDGFADTIDHLSFRVMENGRETLPLQTVGIMPITSHRPRFDIISDQEDSIVGIVAKEFPKRVVLVYERSSRSYWPDWKGSGEEFTIEGDRLLILLHMKF